MVLPGPYVGQTLRLDQPDSVGGEIIAISDISLGTQEKTVPPRTANRVKTGFDIAFQNPLRVCVAQCEKTLINRISAGPLLTKPIGVWIRNGFTNGDESEQMQSLHRSVLHSGNSERAHRFTV